MPNLWLIFTTGLLTGGLTCLAVQGGLLMALRPDKTQTLGFLAAKLISHTILGLILGAIGSAFQLSVTAQIILQLGVVIFMVGSALNLLNVHPIFRYFVIQPPRFLTSRLRGQSTPAALGALTIFIPCGTTQAMMALAVGSGSPWIGALIMFTFILGTSPVFFLLGNVFARLGKLAAATMLVLATFNLNNVLNLAGINIIKDIYCTISFCAGDASVLAAAANTATIYIDATDYKVDNQVLKAGEKITLNVVNRGGRGCIQAFTIPKLGIQKIIRPGQSEVFEFTAPSQPGELAFMCSMGMYRGRFLIR